MAQVGTQAVGTPQNSISYQLTPRVIYPQSSSHTPQSQTGPQLPSIHELGPDQSRFPPPPPHHPPGYVDGRNSYTPEWGPSESPYNSSLPPLRHPLVRSNTHESFVGCEGFPPPMLSRGPKARFTAEEDNLLKRLKEEYTNPKLSWKQIADFFPDRKSGTLQVRYCTKLRKKDDFSWSPELDSQLRQAAQEVEADKWRLISGKLNGRISAQQCQERLEILEAEDLKQQGNEEYEIAGQ